MSEGSPAEEGNAQPATSLPGPEVAACVGVGNTGDGSGQWMEADELDDDSSPVPGRSFDQDVRIAIHEEVTRCARDCSGIRWVVRPLIPVRAMRARLG
jgi:hypothetical protein